MEIEMKPQSRAIYLLCSDNISMLTRTYYIIFFPEYFDYRLFHIIKLFFSFAFVQKQSLQKPTIEPLLGFMDAQSRKFKQRWKPKKDKVRIYIPGDICPHYIFPHNISRRIYVSWHISFVRCCADIYLYISRDINPHYILLRFSAQDRKQIAN